MTDAFSAATATLFADDNLSATGVFTPSGGGTPVTLRVLKRIPSASDLGLGVSRAATNPLVLCLQAADVPAEPDRDGTIQIGAVTYIIEGVRSAARGAQWHCDVRVSA